MSLFIMMFISVVVFAVADYWFHERPMRALKNKTSRY